MSDTDNVVKLPGAAKFNPNSPPPEFIKPSDIDTLTDEQLDTLIENVRMRRQMANYRFHESKRLRNDASRMKLEARYERVMAALWKEIEKFDKYTERLEKATSELRLLRLQLGADPL